MPETHLYKKKTRTFRSKWAACQQCDMGCVPTRIWGFQEFVNREVLIIGEGPSEEDATLEEPMVGADGRYLRKVIDQAESVWKGAFPSYMVTHTVLCVPRDVENFSQIRKPRKSEIDNCAERLQEMVNIIRCRAILCLGPLAAQAAKNLDLEAPKKVFVAPSLWSILAQQERGALDQARLQNILERAFEHAQITRKAKKRLGK